MQLLRTITLATTVSLLTACGGGSGGGDETPQGRTLEAGDRAYAEELAISAGEGSKSLISSESGGFTPIAFEEEGNNLINTLKEKLEYSVVPNNHPDSLSSLPVGVQETSTEKEFGDCGGYYETTRTITTNDSTFYPYSGEAQATYVDYCTGDESYQTVINGYTNWTYTLTDANNSSWSWDYNLSASSTTPYGPQSWTWTFSESCNTVNGIETCTTSSAPYVATSGTSYTFENASVSGNNSSGYNIEGNLTDDQGNSFNVSVEGLTQCGSGNISTGSITITSSTGEVITVSFPNCNECIISYSGDSWTIPQP